MSGQIQELRIKAGKQEPEWVLAVKRAELERMLAAERQAATPEQQPVPDGPPGGPSNGLARDAGREKQIREADQLLAKLQQVLAQPGARDAEHEKQIREAEALLAKLQQELAQPRRLQSADPAANSNKMIDAKKASPDDSEYQYSPCILSPLVQLGLKREAWHTSPRAFVQSAVDSGWLSAGTASNLLNTYFYLTHGVFVLDLVWQARTQFSPHWGIYEIGVLSPMLRVFDPQNQQLSSMQTQLNAAQIDGSFPTVWAAAYIDFGVTGAVIYVLIWGFVAGWSAFGTRHSGLASPPLILTFILASILLSPVQGPLGVANSALILVSMAIAGIAVDSRILRAPGQHAEPESAASRPGQINAS